MVITDPQRVSIILRQGKKPFKNVLISTVLIQDRLIKYFIDNKLDIDTLTKKMEQELNSDDKFKKDLDEWDSEEVL